MASNHLELPDIDSIWNDDLTDPNGKEQRFRALLPEAECSGNPTYLAELLTQLARTQGLQRKFDDAHNTLNRAETLLPDTAPRATVRYHLERGRVFNSSGKPAVAIEYFLRAWELAVAPGEEYHAADAAHMMGIAAEPDEQLAWNLRALEVAQCSADPRTQGWLGSLYNNIGWTYHDLGDFQQALHYFQRSLDWRRQQGRPRETRIAAWTVARALRSLGRCEEALEIQRDNLCQIEESGEPDGFVQEELGECLLALGRAEEARPHFARAYASLSGDPWFVEHEPDRLRRLKELA